MFGKKSKKQGPQCHRCGKIGHVRRFSKELDSESLGLVTQALTVDVCDSNGETWIVDSGATCHMCNNRDLLDDFVKLNNPVEVQLEDGKVLNATGY